MWHTFVSINIEMPAALKKMALDHSQAWLPKESIAKKIKDDLEKAAEYSESTFLEALGD